jgi:TolB-like protein
MCVRKVGDRIRIATQLIDAESRVDIEPNVFRPIAEAWRMAGLPEA